MAGGAHNPHHPATLVVSATLACTAPCGLAVLTSAIPVPPPQVVMDDSPSPGAYLRALPTALPVIYESRVQRV